MPLFVTPPFLKKGFTCASILFAFAAFTEVHAQSQNFTLSQPLLTAAGGTQSFVVPDFNSFFGTLTDVTLSMKIDNKNFTIFNSDNASQDCVSLALKSTTSSATLNSTNLAAWAGSLGNFTVTYTKPADKTVDSMGIAGLLLYSCPKGTAAQYIDVNYTYSLQATPEPSAKYLASIAALAMMVLLVSRSRRQRAGAQSLS